MFKPNLIPRFYQDLSFSDLVSGSKSIGTTQLNYENYLFTGSGRYSLFLVLKSLKPNHKKIAVPAFICHVVFESILRAGFEPVLVDVDENLNLDFIKLEAVKDDFSVILANHTFGKKMNIKSLKLKFPDKIIIEDCCHYPILLFGNKEMESDFQFFSFGLSKYLTIGTGSLLIVKSRENLEKIKNLYEKFTVNKKDSFFQVLKKCVFATAYKKPFYGLFTKDLGALVDKFFDISGKENLDFENLNIHFQNIFHSKLDDFKPKTAKQTTNTLNIVKNIKNNKIRTMPENYHLSDNINFMLPVFTENKENFHDFLTKNGVDSCLYLSNLFDYFTGKKIQFKHCERMVSLVSELVTIPNYFSLSQNQTKKIVSTMNHY